MEDLESAFYSSLVFRFIKDLFDAVVAAYDDDFRPYDSGGSFCFCTERVPISPDFEMVSQDVFGLAELIDKSDRLIFVVVPPFIEPFDVHVVTEVIPYPF